MRLKREAQPHPGKHGGARAGAGRPVGSHLHAQLTQQNLEDVVHARRALVQQIEGSKWDPLITLVSIAANTKKPDELRVQAAGIACRYVHPALSSATVATLHKTVDSAMALKELEAALSRVAPVVDMVVADEPKAAVEAPEAKQEASEPEQQAVLPMLTLVPK